MSVSSAPSVRTVNISGLGGDELRDELDSHGLAFSLDEARSVADLLGRDPTVVEAHIFNTMWSEHCSYKSSRKVLGRHLPTEASNVVLGPGEDAGIVRLCTVGGRTYCVAIAHESHNHPSQVVPNEGAATGIGGIVRDVYCMGADVIGVLDPLRFGDPEGANAERTREIVHGVVEGIWQYGDALGVPNMGGDVYFDSSFDDNCLVNVVALGLVEESEIVRSRVPKEARGAEYDLILVGKPTDPSGFGGATFASRILDEKKAFSDKYAVQIPDPFLKRMLTVASAETLDLARERGAAIGFKDLGAGGIACATSELGAAAGLGVRIDLSKVVTAEPDMLPEVIACSETQERYCLVVPRQLTPAVLSVYNETFELPELCHGAAAVVIGEVIDEPRFVLEFEGATVCDASTEQITAGVCYERARAPRDRSVADARVEVPDGIDIASAVLEVIGSPNVASRERVYRHYDPEVKGHTVVRPGEADAGLVAPVPGSRVGVAVSVDGNPFIGGLDAYQAGAAAVAESIRNVAAVGAVPIALTDCLNFGNPEVPEVFDDFVEAVRGIGDAARGIGQKDSDEPVPIVSGNVSFYNQSSTGRAILPSPIVCCVGRIDDVSHHMTCGFKRDGNALYLLGARGEELGGSAFASVVLGGRGGRPPSVDLERERAMMAGVTDLAERDLAESCHDIADGGLVTAVCEMAMASHDRRAGAALDLSEVAPSGEAELARFLFCEHGGYVVEIAPEREGEAVKTLKDRGVEAARIGRTTRTGALRIAAGSVIVVDMAAVHNEWSTGAARILR